MHWLMLSMVVHASEPTGRWVPVESTEVVQAQVDAAVDTSASEFGLFKFIARKKLEPAAVWCPEYRLDLSGDPIAYQCLANQPIVTPRDKLGEERLLHLDTGSFPTTVDWTHPKMTVRFGGEDGARSNVFHFGDDGTMTLSVSVHSSRMSKPMTFSIAYRRVGDETPVLPPSEGG